ncbi:conserved hypothetical protein [Frankia sp. Hr75.2]|nr:conserved hypothetical protein [Frankia sp. Hr75.2]
MPACWRPAGCDVPAAGADVPPAGRGPRDGAGLAGRAPRGDPTVLDRTVLDRTVRNCTVRNCTVLNLDVDGPADVACEPATVTPAAHAPVVVTPGTAVGPLITGPGGARRRSAPGRTLGDRPLLLTADERAAAPTGPACAPIHPMLFARAGGPGSHLVPAPCPGPDHRLGAADQSFKIVHLAGRGPRAHSGEEARLRPPDVAQTGQQPLVEQR